jgi:hypothetical protein
VRRRQEGGGVKLTREQVTGGWVDLGRLDEIVARGRDADFQNLGANVFVVENPTECDLELRIHDGRVQVRRVDPVAPV